MQIDKMKKIGCCVKIKDIDYAIIQGVDYIELPLSELVFDIKREKIISEIINRKISCNAVTKLLSNNIHICFDDFYSKKVQDYLEDAFYIMNKLGTNIAVFGNSKSRYILENENFETHEKKMIMFCRELARFAKRYDIIVGIEPLNTEQCNYINTLDDAAKIVEKVNHPNLKIVADYYHMNKQNENLESLYKYSNLICHIHTSELASRDFPNWDNDQKQLFKTLNSINYSGFISVETNNIIPNKKLNNFISHLKYDLPC